MTPLHQEEFVETRLKDPFRTSPRMRANRMRSIKDSRLLEDYRRSSPCMKLPTLEMPGDCFPMKRESAVSIIDEALEVIDYGLIIEDDEDSSSSSFDDFMIVPVKMDNYVNKRSRISRGDRRKRELLLDNADAITNALMALEDNNRLADHTLSSDEESLDSGDLLDDSNKSYRE